MAKITLQTPSSYFLGFHTKGYSVICVSLCYYIFQLITGNASNKWRMCFWRIQKKRQKGNGKSRGIVDLFCSGPPLLTGYYWFKLSGFEAMAGKQRFDLHDVHPAARSNLQLEQQIFGQTTSYDF